jgi:hypothetical protein
VNYNINSGYGQQLSNQIAAAVGPVFGKIHVVISASDEAYKIAMLRDMFTPDSDGRVRLYTSLETAYAAVTSNADDIILLAGYASHALVAGIAWTKNRVHVLGMDGGFRLTDQGAKIESSATDTTGYVISVTGTRNTFANIKFIQNSTVEGAKNVALMGGEGNLYKNCSFIFATNANFEDTDTIEVICGEDSGTFIDCEFGADTLLTTGARSVLLIQEVTSGQEFKSNRFRNCTWKISSSSASASFIKVASANDVLFSNLFENANFVPSVDSAGGIALTSAVIGVAAMPKGTLLFANPAAFHVTDIAANGANSNIQVVAAVVSANSNVGVAPTA